MKAYPHHPMWELEPFCLPEYKRWADEHMRVSEEAVHMSADTLMAQLVRDKQQQNADTLSVCTRHVNTLRGVVAANTSTVSKLQTIVEDELLPAIQSMRSSLCGQASLDDCVAASTNRG